MGVKALIFLVMVLVLVSSCSVEKTKPIVSDVAEEAKGKEPKVEGNLSGAGGKVGGGEVIESGGEKAAGEVKEEKKEVLLPETHTIIIKDLKLNPQELVIRKGDKVIWKHEDTWQTEEETKHYLAAHPNTNEFRSPILYYGDTFEHTFNKIGTFTYFDILHKERDYLKGKIIVE